MIMSLLKPASIIYRMFTYVYSIKIYFIKKFRIKRKIGTLLDKNCLLIVLNFLNNKLKKMFSLSGLLKFYIFSYYRVIFNIFYITMSQRDQKLPPVGMTQHSFLDYPSLVVALQQTG